MSVRESTWSGNTSRQNTPTSYQSRSSPAAGRGRYSSWSTQSSQPRWHKISSPSPRPPSPPLGPVLKTLNEKDLSASADLNEYSARITDCQNLPLLWTGKCNRHEKWSSQLTSANQGKPPAWTPLQTPEKLKEDSGEYFRDPNAARFPNYPTEPAVHAIFSQQPDFSASSIDIFACGSTMGNLLRFVRKIDKPFRFLVEVVGNTVFFIRRENSPTELIPRVYGYGHTFPEAYTTWDMDVKGSESHQRIIQYTFNGLKCLVRFGSDGYFRSPNPEAGLQHQSTSAKLVETTDKALAAFALSSPAHQKSPLTPLTIKPGGERVPQSSIFDLKTRSIRKIDQDTLAEELPRLWIAQIPNFVLAYHSYGTFTHIREQNVCKEVSAWETENEESLQRLGVIIRKIIEFVKSKSETKLEVRRVGTGVLELREPEGDFEVLPPEIKALWTGGYRDSEGEEENHISDPIRDNSEYHKDTDDESTEDYTACSADGCGYCGHCSYRVA
ncbi:hypothetical protein GP486_002828 [Trichoglossum hirsutum]|uniref:Geranylgeranyl pyrophosphate synthetase n=1 Tax=Trichoglossum hirsutum TaxID=265104 RepID=A0A9P8LEB1_9PEZI|nr:hypothetical protein GP486_002828 [Trichoglossum hirsutum]